MFKLVLGIFYLRQFFLPGFLAPNLWILLFLSRQFLGEYEQSKGSFVFWVVSQHSDFDPSGLPNCFVKKIVNLPARMWSDKKKVYLALYFRIRWFRVIWNVQVIRLSILEYLFQKIAQINLVSMKLIKWQLTL